MNTALIILLIVSILIGIANSIWATILILYSMYGSLELYNRFHRDYEEISHGYIDPRICCMSFEEFQDELKEMK